MIGTVRGLHPTTPDLGNEFFDALVGPGAKALDAATPLADLERLREGTVSSDPDYRLCIRSADYIQVQTGTC